MKELVTGRAGFIGSTAASRYLSRGATVAVVDDLSRLGLVFSSANRLDVGLEDVGVVVRDGRHAYDGLPNGVGEDPILDFFSPYGCSKGAADLGRTITVYCDGTQFQDGMFVDNLVAAFELAARQIDRTPGHVSRTGSRLTNYLLLVGLHVHLDAETLSPMTFAQDNWRSGDQGVSNILIRPKSVHVNCQPRSSNDLKLPILDKWPASKQALVA